MRRRDFIQLIVSSAAVWPCTVHAQQQSAMPVIGFLRTTSADDSAPLLEAFRQGLKEVGYVDGQNVAIEYRWAEGHYDRLPALADDLVHRRVAVLVATAGAALAAKAATAKIPIVFTSGGDPVKRGLVASLNRPGGNVTGVTVLTISLDSKRLELLRELVPNAGSFGNLLDTTLSTRESQSEQLRAAAGAIGQHVQFVEAARAQDFDKAFASLAEGHAAALLVGSSPIFFSQRERLVALAALHALPAIYEWREFVEAGGLMSYGTKVAEAYRLAGVYAGRILKGEKPADLPVQQSTAVELVINLKTAKALGLAIPPSLLARADEVIE